MTMCLFFSILVVSRLPPFPVAVENLFLVGSPVTVFLSLRGYNPASQKHNPTALGQPMSAHRAPHIYGGCGDGLPAVKRLWNIFHRYDPVAYRIEPMIDIAMSGAPVPLMPKGALSKYAEVRVPLVRYPMHARPQSMAGGADAQWRIRATTMQGVVMLLMQRGHSSRRSWGLFQRSCRRSIRFASRGSIRP